MRRITIKHARTWHYRKMRPCIEPSNDLAPLSPFRSWLDCTTNTSGYDFRKGQRLDSGLRAETQSGILRMRHSTRLLSLWPERVEATSLRDGRTSRPVNVDCAVVN